MSTPPMDENLKTRFRQAATDGACAASQSLSTIWYNPPARPDADVVFRSSVEVGDEYDLCTIETIITLKAKK